MDHCSMLLLLLYTLGSVPSIMGCFCDHYSWTPWSICSKTCNYGTQSRRRQMRYDQHYYENNCATFCTTQETRACNAEACPINCLLKEWSDWSTCSPCAKKQFKTRSVLRPGQFGGQACSESLMDHRPCHPATECRIEKVNCGKMFTCDSGRCIKSILVCNNQNDCGDNSDEKNCGKIKRVCASDRRHAVIPGAELIGNGFDVASEMQRGAVLDNSFLGEDCRLNRSREDRKVYRIPANIESYDFKVETKEDFKFEDMPAKTEPINFSSMSASSSNSQSGSSLLVPIPILFTLHKRRWSTNSESFKKTAKASQEKDSKFFRLHQVVATSNFKTKSSDLYLSHNFMEFLSALPLEYNYALYRQVFQVFGTHYFSSGSLGGIYDLLYQYDREQLKTSGTTDSEVNSCISKEFTLHVILYYTHSSSKTCGTTKMTERYEGSYMKSAEKSISMVKGGRSEYTMALSMEKKGARTDSTTYKNWLYSTIDNPTVIDYELLPLVNLVRGIPCAVTKRRHLHRALIEYLEVFDSCQCAPCPNNARPVLSGTDCLCVCHSGTYGANCEKRARDYTSDAMDGRWSCWSPWTVCDTSMRRRRSRECNNPAPSSGGKPCEGPSKQEDECFISIFQDQNVCINDDDFVPDVDTTVPPGTELCSKPKPPPNSYFRRSARRYKAGEHDEFVCFTGYELDGYQLVYCKEDGTWQEPKGRCIKTVCAPPTIPTGMKGYPVREQYKIGESIGLDCLASGMVVSGQRFYTCGKQLTWEPLIPEDLKCVPETPFVPDTTCKRGEKRVGSACVCYTEEECSQYPEEFCVLDANAATAMMMSYCAFHAGRCRGENLHFMNEGPCKNDLDSFNWAKYRASVASKSSIQEPCGSDTCYEWETCSDGKQCQCELPRDCAKITGQQHQFCLKMGASMVRSMNLCFVAAMTCRKMDFEILNEGPCESR